MTSVGTGKYTYSVIEGWAKLPPGESFGMVSGIATDSQDQVYAFQRKDPPVMVFDSTGNFLSSWGNGALLYAHGFHIAGDVVYLTDRDASVCMLYTLDGNPIQILGKHGVHSDTGCEEPGSLVPRSAGPFNYPSELVPSPSGDLYVSDGYRNARVHRFSADGQLKKSWGEPGKVGPGQFHLPHSLLVDTDEKVYLCDRENHRIQIFSSEGEHQVSWTDIQHPMDMAEDKDGVLYVSEGPMDSGSYCCALEGTRGLDVESPARVSILDKQGKVLARFSCRGSGHGIWVDSQGDIYLAGVPDAIDKYVLRN